MATANLSPSAAATATTAAKGFLRSLYDFGFTSLVTTKIIKVVYALLVALFSLMAIIFFVAGLASRTAIGVIFAIVLDPIIYLLYVIAARIVMEVLIVFFRMGSDVETIRASGGSVGRAV